MIDFFFDIDGTILPFGRPVPRSAVQAIREARAAGNKVFLATGRSEVEVQESIMSIGFDGGVYSAGADIVADGKHIFRKVMTDDEKSFLLSYCRRRGFHVLVQTAEGTYVSQESFDFWRSAMLRYVGAEVELSSIIISDSIPADSPVIKLQYVTDHADQETIRKDLAGNFSVVGNTEGLPQDMMGEIVMAGITKATGIDCIIAHYGDDPARTAAFGDGANDIEMIERAALGIAMGNASADLKAVADWIAPSVDDDGLKAGIEYVRRLLEPGFSSGSR